MSRIIAGIIPLILLCVLVSSFLFINLHLITGLSKPYVNIHQSELAREKFVWEVSNESRQLLIVSEARSGSSLTGDILQQAKESFYVFEPLHALEKLLWYGRTNTTLLDGNIIFISHSSFIKRSLEIIEAYTTCNFTIMDYPTLLDPLHWQSHKYAKFMDCVNTISKNSVLYNEIVTKTCLPVLVHLCKSSKIRIMKIIRLPVKVFREIMLKYHSLHVLHLLRDPRAVLYSKSKFGVDLYPNTEQKAKFLCNKMLEDVKAIDTFKRLFPSRTKSLFYEDLAKRPLIMSKTLYKNYNIRFTKDIEYHVYMMTSSGETPSCDTMSGLCLRTGNSSTHINRWQKFINDTIRYTINRGCEPLYEEVNYFYH